MSSQFQLDYSLEEGWPGESASKFIIGQESPDQISGSLPFKDGYSLWETNYEPWTGWWAQEENTQTVSPQLVMGGSSSQGSQNSLEHHPGSPLGDVFYLALDAIDNLQEDGCPLGPPQDGGLGMPLEPSIDPSIESVTVNHPQGIHKIEDPEAQGHKQTGIPSKAFKRIYKCPEPGCPKKYTSKSGLQYHIRVSADFPPTLLQDVVFSWVLKTVLPQAGHGRNGHDCPKCKMNFKGPASLRKHAEKIGTASEECEGWLSRPPTAAEGFGSTRRRTNGGKFYSNGELAIL